MTEIRKFEGQTTTPSPQGFQQEEINAGSEKIADTTAAKQPTARATKAPSAMHHALNWPFSYQQHLNPAQQPRKPKRRKGSYNQLTQAGKQTASASTQSPKSTRPRWHRDVWDRPTSKLYGHLFSIAGKGLDGSKISNSLSEVAHLTGQYSELLSAKNPKIAKKYSTLSQLIGQAERWYNNPDIALRELKEALATPATESAHSQKTQTSDGQERQVVPGKKALLTIGILGLFDGKSIRHAMQFEITGRENNKLLITIHNTGAGIDHNHDAITHEAGSTRYSTTRDEAGKLMPKLYQPYVQYDNIKVDDLDEIVRLLDGLEEQDIEQVAPGLFTLHTPASRKERQDILGKIDHIYSLLSSKGDRQPKVGEYEPPQPDGFCAFSTAISFVEHYGANEISDIDHFKFLHAARESVIRDTLAGIPERPTPSDALPPLSVDTEILDDALNILETSDLIIKNHLD